MGGKHEQKMVRSGYKKLCMSVKHDRAKAKNIFTRCCIEIIMST